MSAPLYEMLLGGGFTPFGTLIAKPSIRGLTWVPNKSYWIGVGELGAVSVSEDGLTWYTTPSGRTETLWNVEYADNTLVAVVNGTLTDTKKVIVSKDYGVTWSTSTALGNAAANVQGTCYVRYGNGLWVINYLGSGIGGYQYSTDLINWTNPVNSNQTSAASSPKEPLWTGTKWILPQINTLPTRSTSDWITYTNLFNAGTTGARETDKMGNILAVICNNGTVQISTDDGVSWTQQSTGTTTNLLSIANNGSRFVIVGANGSVFYSSNGITWNIATSGVTSSLEDVQWNGSYFLACSTNISTLIKSNDGINWSIVY